jgi:hypothetical protein
LWLFLPIRLIHRTYLVTYEVVVDLGIRVANPPALLWGDRRFRRRCMNPSVYIEDKDDRGSELQDRCKETFDGTGRLGLKNHTSEFKKRMQASARTTARAIWPTRFLSVADFNSPRKPLGVSSIVSSRAAIMPQ